MLYIECVDCEDELVGKRLEAVGAWLSYCKRHGLKPGPSRCLVCQEIYERERGRQQPSINPESMAALSEVDDSKRVREEGWRQDDMAPIRPPRPQEDEAA